VSAPGEVLEVPLWTAYKHEAEKLFELLEQDKGHCDWVVPAKYTHKIEFIRKIEVAVLTQIRKVGRPFVRAGAPENWDFKVYLDLVGREKRDYPPGVDYSHPYGFVQLSFFYNWKLWNADLKEDAVAKSLERLKLDKGALF